MEYLHQGLVIKPFTLSFTLAEHMHVSAAEFTHGLLHINLVRDVPEALQPQKIAIGTEKPALENQSDKCYLFYVPPMRGT